MRLAKRFAEALAGMFDVCSIPYTIEDHGNGMVTFSVEERYAKAFKLMIKQIEKMDASPWA